MKNGYPDNTQTAFDAHLNERDFRRLADLIEGHCGIRMPPIKRTLVEGRLRARLRVHGLSDFGDYCDFLFRQDGLKEEGVFLIDAITTNKTEFFREPQHFDILVQRILPDWLAQSRPPRQLRVWSAGSSIGCEAYTIAMVLSDARAAMTADFDIRILGTDICTKVLEKGQRAIYPDEMIEPVPMDMRKRYLLRSREKDQHLVRIVPAIRRMVQFQYLNFMDRTYDIREAFDVVFCRNVIIYFDRPTRQMVLERICRHIARGGTLFVGHSENLNDLTLPLRQVAPTVYRKV